MSDLYPLSQTAQEVQIALDAVTSPDQTPTLNSDSFVTSGGVKAYVDGAVGNLAGKTVITSSDTFPDNDTTIPTSGAVSNAIAAATASVIKTAFLTAPDSISPGTFNDQVIPFTISSDPYNIISVTDGYITPTASGVYQFLWTGFFGEDNNSTDYFDLKFRAGTTVLANSPISETGGSPWLYPVYRQIFTIHNNASGSTSYSAFADEVGGSTLYYRDQLLLVIKIT